MTKAIDYADRSTCVLFGDGAGAALLKRPRGRGILISAGDSDGAGRHGPRAAGHPRQIDGTAVAPRLLQQNGRAVYEWAVKAVSNGVAACSRRPTCARRTSTGSCRTARTCA